MNIQDRIDLLFHAGKSVEEIASSLGLRIEDVPQPLWYLGADGFRVAGIPGRKITRIHGNMDEGEFEVSTLRPGRRAMQTRYFDVPREKTGNAPPFRFIKYESPEGDEVMVTCPSWRLAQQDLTIIFHGEILREVVLAGVPADLQEIAEDSTIYRVDLDKVLRGEPWLTLVVDGEEWKPL